MRVETIKLQEENSRKLSWFGVWYFLSRTPTSQTKQNENWTWVKKYFLYTKDIANRAKLIHEKK